MKHKRLIHIQNIIDVKVHLSMLESYLEVRIQIPQMSWKLVYNISSCFTN